jgi:hypothetical protein
MHHADEELSYSTHLTQYKHYILNGNIESIRHFTHQAQHMHALCVWGASQELIFKSLSLSNVVTNSIGQNHLRYGLGRRTNTIFHSFRSLYHTIPPDRVITLSTDDATEMSAVLNTLYLNIKGALDNFAYCLNAILAKDERPKFKEDRINLFNPAFVDRIGFEAVKALVEPFKSWHKDFKSRRDPAAHRIPLAVIPSIQTPETLQEYHRYEGLISETTKEAVIASQSLDYEISRAKFLEIQTLRERQEKVGKFEPCFQFDVQTLPIFIYPTVAEDVGVFVVFSRKLLDLISVSSKH